LQLGVQRDASFHWGVLNTPKKIGGGPMNMALSNKTKKEKKL
jgi:hypothetical protein